MDHAKSRYLATIALLFVAAVAPGQLQNTKADAGDSPYGQQGRTMGSVLQPAGMPLESLVDPERYIVGPSDVIAVNLWMSPPLSFSLTVTPEGSLIVPTIGEVPVAGLSLALTKARVLKEIRVRYARAEATVTLVNPRPIVVNVVGKVLNPGLYTVTAADRAGKVLELANTVLASQRGVEPPDNERVAMRTIRLRHRDGSEETIDLLLYAATKDPRLNPLLREGDVVVVPERDASRFVVGVYGEVNTPGRFEFVQGDSLTTLFRLGNGFTAHARRDSVLFRRLSKDGISQRMEIVDLDRIIRRELPDRALESGDALVVTVLPDLRQDYRIHVVGEVMNPGTYPITRDRTKLSEVVALAGGFTETAAIRNAQLIRRSISPSEVELETLESARGGIANEDSLDYKLETSLRIRKEIVAVNFGRLFLERDSTQDVIVRSEDRISVPRQKHTVYVFGQVVTNGYIPFVEGRSVEYYVKEAGGFTERAREGDTKIVKSQTHQWLAPDETTIEPGDYIWVPRQSEHSFGYYMNVIGQTASVVSVAVSIVLLVLQLQK